MKLSKFKFLIVMVGISAMTLTSCKKASTAADNSVSAQDVSNVSNAVNATSDDATSAAGQVKSYSGKTEAAWWNSAVLCGATTVDTGSAGNHVITITYDGTSSCNGMIRSGSITVSNTTGVLWNTAGAELTVNYNNLKVTDIVSGNTYTISGTHTITNVTGGLAWQVIAGLSPSGTTVTHRNQSSNMSVTFPNGSQRTWTVDRTRSWNITGTVITVTVSSQASGNVSESGTNRFGDAFTNTITTPITADNTCLWRPYAGEVTHQIGSATGTITYGTDPSGNHVGTPSYCGSYGTYGFYITYTNGSVNRTRFVSYWR